MLQALHHRERGWYFIVANSY